MDFEERFPGLARYLAALPEGLDSYPESQSKGSLVRSTLQWHDARELLSELPETLALLVREPPPAAIWTPAVHGIALVHAVCDRYYRSDEEVLAWGARRSRALAKQGLYRAVLRVSGPRFLFSMTPRLNSMLQRGTHFENVALEPGRVLARLTYPPHLHSRRTLLGTVALCRTLVELTGGECTGAEMPECTETHATFECTWA